MMDKLEHVHHLDENPWNNDPKNLAAAHAFCHNSAHHLGWAHTPEARAQITATLLYRMSQLSAEERKEKFGHPGERNPFYGRSHTPETREKIGRAARGRPGPKTVHTEETKRVLSEKVKALPKKWCDECQRSWAPSTWSRHVRKYHEGGKW